MATSRPKRLLRRWNYETHSYHPFSIPDDWNIVLYSEDMKTLVNCADCGLELEYGNTFTSREIHTDVGFGYPVCGKSYAEEVLRDPETPDSIKDEYREEYHLR